MKLSGRRTARLRPSEGGCRANPSEAFGDAVGDDCDEFGRAAWRSVNSVLVGALAATILWIPSASVA